MKLRDFKGGFLVGGGLLVVGLLLQVSIGPIDWRFFAAPVNFGMLALLIVLIGAMYLLRRKVHAFEWMMHYGAAIPCLCYAVGLTIVMGLTEQTRQGGIPWLSQMLRFWPFVLIWTWMAVIAGLTTLNHLLRWKWKEIPFIFNHLGLFLALVCATLGSADRQTLQMTVFEGRPEGMALEENGRGHEMDFTIDLHRFTMDRYGDGSPKRFASDISVSTKDGRTVSGTVEVNRPLKVNGWKIYQYGYDVQRGSESTYSVFMLVRDPWLPAVYLGILLMLAGALCLIGLKYVPKRLWVLLAALLLTGFFTYLTVSRMGPNARDLPPALQSPWFLPHLIVYMAGYALLAMATLMAAYRLVFKRFPVKPGMTEGVPGMTEGKMGMTEGKMGMTGGQMGMTEPEAKGMGIIDNLVYVGLAFLTTGMLFGALWAKEAWGHYWAWDPKETWAAITWLCYLVYLHFRKARPSDGRTACWILLFAFACLQLCWWGVNYLPSARGHSVHTY